MLRKQRPDDGGGGEHVDISARHPHCHVLPAPPSLPPSLPFSFPPFLPFLGPLLPNHAQTHTELEVRVLNRRLPRCLSILLSGGSGREGGREGGRRYCDLGSMGSSRGQAERVARHVSRASWINIDWEDGEVMGWRR